MIRANLTFNDHVQLMRARYQNSDLVKPITYVDTINAV